MLQLFCRESSFNMFWNFALTKSFPVFWKKACIWLLQSTETRRPFLGKTMEEILNLLHHLFYLFHHSHIWISFVVARSWYIILWQNSNNVFRPKMQSSLSLFIFERRLTGFFFKNKGPLRITTCARQWWQLLQVAKRTWTQLWSAVVKDRTLLSTTTSFLFLEKQGPHFFPKISTASLLFYPRFHPRIKRPNKNIYQKIECCEQSAIFVVRKTYFKQSTSHIIHFAVFFSMKMR